MKWIFWCMRITHVKGGPQTKKKVLWNEILKPAATPAVLGFQTLYELLFDSKISHCFL